MPELLSLQDLPDTFHYPQQFVRAVELGITQLEPWWIVGGELLRRRYVGLRERYPPQELVPFAVRQDCDNIACFDVSSGKVLVIQDFADPGFERRGEFEGFDGWLRRAVEDFLEWGRL